MNLLLIPLIWVLDQWTKEKAEKSLSLTDKVYIAKGNASLRLVYNRGAFLGFLKNQPSYLHLFTLVALGVIVIMGLPYWITGKDRLTGTGLALIFAGAMGNYTDRVFKGYVVDFLAFKPNHKVHFNLADFAIFIGAGMMVIGEFIGQ